MSYIVKILSKTPVTHNVNHYRVEKPAGFKFSPGQATEVSINKPGFEDKKHPFTFTSLNEESTLEFTIKSYPVVEFPEHEGVTEKLATLVSGDELIIDDPWGTIQYKGAGVFIAGGAGVTPFIAILRQLHKDNKLKGNKLFFSNKTEKDIILKEEFDKMFKDSSEDLVYTLTREENPKYEHGRINKQFLEKKLPGFKGHFYICGPKPMKFELIEIAKELRASVDSIVFEE